MGNTGATVAVLGAGSMGSAIIEGLLRSPDAVGDIRVTTRTAGDRAWSGRVDHHVIADHPDANRRAIASADVVILGVKPGMIADLLDEIGGVLHPQTVVVSVAAGLTTATMEARLPEGVSVVRAMPNTPSAVGLGVTALSRGHHVSDDQMELVRAVFRTVGEVLEIPEQRMDALTAVSGSGPAYVFYLIEGFLAAAQEVGFEPEEADLLVGQTFRGALELLRRSGKTAEQLRRDVTSPGGTTEQGIRALADADVHGAALAAVRAAEERSREMSRGD